MIKVFWIEPSTTVRRSLRRYRSSSEGAEKCPLAWGYHNAETPIESFETPIPGTGEYEQLAASVSAFKDDPRWPTHCQCGYEFQPDDTWQVFQNREYVAVATGERMTLNDAKPGAMWDAWWMSVGYAGPDGIHLMVKLPNGSDWCVDGQASNCTRDQYVPYMGEDGRQWRRFARSHYCWVRHGDPRSGVIHVDKNGDTCAAGAGSIVSGNYHGFLHDSHLTNC